jgi:U3 small nucleolar RNA-associated protein 20
MPATSSGRIVKVRKTKGATLHQKNHRWESFTTKISKLNSLDPIRRVRRHDLDREDLETTTSYFKSGLAKWRELNMSEPFVEFTNEVLPMCDTLPQILHFEDQIMNIMVAYMEKRERESLEPLLELVTDFAHDLGTRFEKHYAKILELVASIAGTPQDVAVIEWSFTCLAFMFKYLSKLLVPDLRPTYDLMAPLLGKHRQQPHIARFAAEALSYLIKKAGAPAHRDRALPLIIDHAKRDLLETKSTKEFGLYYHGIMTLFAEAMKGNGLSIHTSGPTILNALFSSLDDADWNSLDSSPWLDVLSGVMTSMIHHTSSDTFKDVLETIVTYSNTALESFQASSTIGNLYRVLYSSRCIGIACGVRKGTRVRDWPVVLRSMSNILRVVSKNYKLIAEIDSKLFIWKHLVLSVSIVLQYSPMDAAIPFISPLLDSLTKDPLAEWFLTFSSYFSEVDSGRFRTIVLPYFQR